jgi:DNA polymerase-3 subunit delta'
MITLAQALATQVPSLVIAGPEETTQTYVIQNLQKILCPLYSSDKKSDKKQDCYCVSCRQIKNLQHSSLLWLAPTKDYTVSDIDEIFNHTQFQLDPGQQFFIVLNKAHTLTTTTGNRLLKLLEEPPAGYFFLLLANNIQALIPTIRSRSYVISLLESQEESTHPILEFFTQQKPFNPLAFEQTLKKYSPTETESLDLLTRLYSHYADQYKLNIQQDFYKKILAYLTIKQKRPPQPGSSEFFWKNFYLSFPRQ